MLKPAQGHVIPIFFGQVEYDDTRVLILSDIGGACLVTPEGAVLLKDIIQDLYQIMVQVSTYDSMGRSSRDVLSTEM
ncbi:hypothetical protein NM208_g10293 [Fusarium decemcellulare]|uniref:Uncharacterized protein n=1 Tax=Fusarium decemcellulare TaxID=57161 RepID=A0ACC1RYG6_9HYPO|nr:hypothetical protein NM208_g10293 [Fusarium decemcellulare]